MYYAPEEKLQPIYDGTWAYVASGRDLCTEEYRHRTDMEWLSARQMFEIADLAPKYDCLELDFYKELADKTGVELGNDLSDFLFRLEKTLNSAVEEDV